MRAHGVSPRSFGFTVGTACAALAALSWWRHHPTAATWLGCVGAVLLLFAAVRPSVLESVNAVWMALARALGWVNSRILLSVLFAAVLTPVGLAARLAGWDPLRRRRTSGTGWSAYPPRLRDSKYYEHLY